MLEAIAIIGGIIAVYFLIRALLGLFAPGIGVKAGQPTPSRLHVFGKYMGLCFVASFVANISGVLLSGEPLVPEQEPVAVAAVEPEPEPVPRTRADVFADINAALVTWDSGQGAIMDGADTISADLETRFLTEAAKQIVATFSALAADGVQDKPVRMAMTLGEEGDDPRETVSLEWPAEVVAVITGDMTYKQVMDRATITDAGTWPGGDLREYCQMFRRDSEQLCAQFDALCRPHLRCWGEVALGTGEFRCARAIERAAQYGHDWTNGWLEDKFTRYLWQDEEEGVITLIGDRIKLQNAFGAFSNFIYDCDFDPATKIVHDVRVEQGRL